MANSGGACGKMTGTGVVNYPCILPPHDGPCVAKEIPATGVARANWEKHKESPPKAKAKAKVVPDAEDIELAGLGGEEAAAAAAPLAAIVDSVGPDDIGFCDEEPDEPAPQPKPKVVEQPASILPINLSGFITSDIYLDSVPTMIGQMEKFADMPQAVRTAMQNTSTRRALTVLWNSADEVFQLGAQTITLTREDVEALVPSFLRRQTGDS